MEKLFNCTHISVDCVENDPINLEFEGPAFLGFDFYVLTKDLNEFENYIRKEIKENEVPLMGLRKLETLKLTEDKIWTKEKISKEIKNEANFLISAEERAISLRLEY